MSDVVETPKPNDPENPIPGRDIIDAKGRVIITKKEPDTGPLGSETPVESGKYANIGSATFDEARDVLSLAESGVDVPEPVLRKAKERMERLIIEAENRKIFSPEVFAETIRRVDWPDLPETLSRLGENLNIQAVKRNKNFDGVIPYVYEGGYYGLVVLGAQTGQKGKYDPDWQAAHGYDQAHLDEYEERAREQHAGIVVKPGMQNTVNEIQRKKEEEIASYYKGSVESEDERNERLRREEEKEKREVAQAKEETQYRETMLGYQEAQIELMKKGLKGFIKGIEVRAHINPEQYDQSLPPWFEELLPSEQTMFRNILSINYLAAVKRDSGMASLDSWTGIQGLRIEKPALVQMWKNLPGFRVALATMVNDIFVQDAGYFVISGNNKDKAAPTGGYRFVGSEERLDRYKEDLVYRIGQLLDHEYGDRIERKYRISNEDMASLSVSVVDSLLFGSGAYDSGDEARAITPGDANVYSEQIRAFMMPGVKGRAKWVPEWLVNEDMDPAKAEEKRSKGISEEDFGGPLGRWIRENASKNRNGFRDRLLAGEIQLIPDRLFCSMLDHETFSKDVTGWYAGMPISQALLESTMKVSLGNGLVDFVDGAATIDFNDIGSFELLGDYADGRGGAVKIFKELTSDKPEERLLNKDALANALIKERKDPLTGGIFLDEDLVTACVALTASPTGFVMGTDEMILNLDESIYDSTVNDILNDTRITQGMAPGSRERILRRLHAIDSRSVRYQVKSLLPGVLENNIFDERARIRKQAIENIRFGR